MIGIDSQCLSYLIDAIQDVNKPSDHLASEKIALFRIYLYEPGTFFVTPTVIEECAAIRNKTRKELHDMFIGVFFDDAQVQNMEKIEARTNEFKHYHSGANDCRILAEAEESELIAIISYDYDFLNRLGGVSPSVKIYRPTEYWTGLDIEKGSKPDKIPSRSNPIEQQKWWKW